MSSQYIQVELGYAIRRLLLRKKTTNFLFQEMSAAMITTAYDCLHLLQTSSLVPRKSAEKREYYIHSRYSLEEKSVKSCFTD